MAIVFFDFQNQITTTKMSDDGGAVVEKKGRGRPKSNGTPVKVLFIFHTVTPMSVNESSGVDDISSVK